MAAGNTLARFTPLANEPPASIFATPDIWEVYMALGIRIDTLTFQPDGRKVDVVECVPRERTVPWNYNRAAGPELFA